MTPYNRNLIGTREIAIILGVTQKHVTGRIIKQADFPKPVLNLSRRIRKWNIEEVQKYLKAKSR